jgi:hypothetical protein
LAEAVNFNDLTYLMRNMPRIPRRELKCHPSVVEALRSEVPVEAVAGFGFCQLKPDLLNIQVYEDYTLGWGEWFLKEDDITVASGIIRPEPILNRLTEDDDFFGYGGRQCEPRG